MMKLTNEEFSNLIDIVASNSYDANKVVRSLIKLEPELFLKIVNELDATNVPDYAHQIFSHIKSGNKIEAIKTVRVRYASGLKEAKDAVDSLQHFMYQHELCDTDYSDPPYMAPYSPAFNVYQDLVKFLRIVADL